MVRLIFGRDFAAENEGFLCLKLLCQKECGYKVEELNFMLYILYHIQIQ